MKHVCSANTIPTFVRWAGAVSALGLAASLLPLAGCAGPTSPPCGEFGEACAGLPVVAVAGPDVNVAPDSGTASAVVQLDGSLSFSRNDLPLNYVWTEQGTTIGEGPTPEVVLSEGTHLIVLHVTDTLGDTNSDMVTVTVGAAQPASCGAAGAPALGAILLAIGLMRLTRAGGSGPSRKPRNS